MTIKLYNDLERLIYLENQLASEDRILEAFLNVKRGDRFSLEDLQIVQKMLAAQTNVLSNERHFNLSNTIVLLRERVVKLSDRVSNAESKVMKNNYAVSGMEKERLLEHYRLQMSKEKKELKEKEPMRSR